MSSIGCFKSSIRYSNFNRCLKKGYVTFHTQHKMKKKKTKKMFWHSYLYAGRGVCKVGFNKFIVSLDISLKVGQNLCWVFNINDFRLNSQFLMFIDFNSINRSVGIQENSLCLLILKVHYNIIKNFFYRRFRNLKNVIMFCVYIAHIILTINVVQLTCLKI